jgi:hypothetical protein
MTLTLKNVKEKVLTFYYRAVHNVNYLEFKDAQIFSGYSLNEFKNVKEYLREMFSKMGENQ